MPTTEAVHNDDVLDVRITKPDPPRAAKAAKPAKQYGTGRAAVLLVLVLVVQLGFTAAYLNALDAPAVGDLPVAVVAGDPAVSRVLAQTRGAAPTQEYANRDAALQAVHDREAYAALVPDGAGGSELRIATARTDPAAQGLVRAFQEASTAVGVRAVVFDNYSPRADDSRSLSTLFLVVGWVLGGFLAAAALAIALGAVPASERRTQARVLALLAYALVSGVAGAVLVGPVLGIWTGYGVALATFGTMIVFGAAMTAAALQSWFGLLGAGAAIALFLVLGIPGAGGELPGQSWALPGAGTELVRRALSLDSGTGGSGDVVTQMAALWLYCLGGAVAFLVAGHVRGRRR